MSCTSKFHKQPKQQRYRLQSFLAHFIKTSIPQHLERKKYILNTTSYCDMALTCSLLQQKEIAHWFPKVWFWWGVVAIAGEEWRGVGGHTFVSFVVLLFCCCCSLLLFLLFSYNKQEDNTALVAFLQLQPSQCHSPEYKTGPSGRKEK